MADARITNPDDIFRYIMAGRATLTLVSTTSGQRFTYQVSTKFVRQEENESAEDYAKRLREALKGPRFVSVLTGPDNTRDYTYLGHINDREQRFRTDKRSSLKDTAPSVRAWAWFWDVLMRRLMSKLDTVEVWHNGRCSRCGRALTVPESVASGLGPICAGELRGALPAPLAPQPARRTVVLNPTAPLTFRPTEITR